jgi:hypothetical protein
MGGRSKSLLECAKVLPSRKVNHHLSFELLFENFKYNDGSQYENRKVACIQ